MHEHDVAVEKFESECGGIIKSIPIYVECVFLW